MILFCSKAIVLYVDYSNRMAGIVGRAGSNKAGNDTDDN
ncbi:hypothetical protein SpAn4DRAFT_2635 [Sporomusa ovata]|uniref:Uncharacterized protein n=1 Tax=Sporomusa ovata TaxID=2378 RepID=A0A0U1L2M2_9FIRM|nr:hypothetical protein SpAn4DRAFT_2635 [Sporomusa ovata]